MQDERLHSDPVVTRLVNGSARYSPVRPVAYRRRRWRPERAFGALVTLAMALGGWTFMTWVSLWILAWLGWRP